ncbi:MAG: hypothetical protein M3R17_05950 [Bacteroidota bacterium]|nr:hypothetical protein [Bacteroidota bacterium]
MKKSFLCLMIACLSLFAYPGIATAGTINNSQSATELPIVPPALEKKAEQFKKNHPGMFSQKENKEAENTSSGSKHGGGAVYISGGVLLLIIILLIILL